MKTPPEPLEKTIPEPFTAELVALCTKFLTSEDEREKTQAFYEIGDMFVDHVDDAQLIAVPEWAHQIAKRVITARMALEREVERTSREVIRRIIAEDLVQIAEPCPKCAASRATN